ncbi:MAG: hypothetical protein WCJ30_00025 [Deltaproteobacteria bacterium]
MTPRHVVLWLALALVATSGCQVQPGSAPRPRPPGVVTCHADRDCVLYDNEVSGSNLCCPGCTQRAGSRSEVDRFHRECDARGSTMCPPIGCAMPILRAVCRAGRCSAVP